MGQFTPKTDNAGNICYSMADATVLAQRLAADPAQPFVFGSSCSLHTELMIGRALEWGVDAAAIGRAHIFATDNPLDPTALAEGRVMHRDNARFGATNFQQLKAADTEGALDKLSAQGIIIREYEGNKHRAEVLGPNKEGWMQGDEYIGYVLGFGKGADRWHNHVTLSIRVLDERTGNSSLMVIDPHLQDPPKPTTFAEWKSQQNCERAVMFQSTLGRKSELVTEPGALNAGDTVKLTGLLDAIKPSDKSFAERLQGLTPADYDNVVRTMVNDNENHFLGKSTPRIITGPAERKFPELVKPLEPRKDYADFGGDWNEMTKAQQQALTQRWVQELHPLKAVENWAVAQQAKLQAAQPQTSLSSSSRKQAASVPSAQSRG